MQKTVNMISSISLLYILVVAVSSVGANELLFTSVVHRHGERTPVSFYPHDPNEGGPWPRGLGQLTNKGKQQEYQLGKFMKNRYGYLIGKQYFANVTYYRSTDVDRTLMSAQLVSAALFQPEGDDVWNDQLAWQPVPIHTEKTENDFLLSRDSTCPEYFRLYAEALNVPPLSTVSAKYKDLFEYLSKYIGSEVNITNTWKIYDPVSKELAMNMSEPKWLMDVWDSIVKLKNVQFGVLAPSRTMKRLKGGPFIKEIVENCKKKAAGNLKYKIMLYSGHDSTLSIILESLNIYNGLQPPYASAIFVEFYRTGKKGNDYADFALKFFYKNSSSSELLHLVVPGCNNPLCPFDTFLKVVKDIIPDDIASECSGEKLGSNSLRLLMWIIGSFVAVEVIAGVLLYLFFRRSRPPAGFQPIIN